MDSDNTNNPSDRDKAKHDCCPDHDVAQTFLEAGDLGFSSEEATPVVLGDGPDAPLLPLSLVDYDLPSHVEADREPPEKPNPRVYLKPPTSRDDHCRYQTGKEFSEAYSALAFTNNYGAVLDASVSIDWTLLGITDQKEISTVFCHGFRKAAKSWFEYRTSVEVPFVWLYVHHIGHTHGLCTHMLLSIPEEHRHDFGKWFSKRLTAISRTDRVPDGAYVAIVPRNASVRRQWSCFQYMFTGVDPEAELPSVVGPEPFIKVQSLIRPRAQSPGRAECPRSIGIAEPMRKSQRQDAKFQSLVEQGVLDRRRLYAGMERLSFLRRQTRGSEDREFQWLQACETKAVKIAVEESQLQAQHAEERSRKKRIILAQNRQEKKRLRQQLDSCH